MESPLEKVIELQKALSKLDTLEGQLDGIPDWMQELHEEHSTRRGAIDATQEAIDEHIGRRRAAEAGIADQQEKLKTFQAQLGQVRNEREYGALLHEIDGSKQQIRELEESALEALEAQEERQEELAKQKEAFAELDTRYAEALAKWETEKPELARQADELRRVVEQVEGKLPPATLTLFRRIRERHHGLALATVMEVTRAGKGPQLWHCGGCNYRVRPQAVVEIADQGKVVLCDGCKRILILPEQSS